MNVAIIGLGHIGGSLAKDLKAEKIARRIFGIDKNPETVRKALAKKIITDAGSLEDLEHLDLVIVSIPVDALETLCPTVLDRIGSKTTVMDVGSTKSKIIQQIQNHPKRHQFVATHPIAGKETHGIENCLTGLFDQKKCIICDAKNSNEDSLQKVIYVFETIGSDILYMDDPEEHDKHMAYVSHLSHISSFALSNTVLELEEKSIFNMAGSGFESTVRLAKSNPKMWSAIFTTNQKHVLNALNAYITELQKLKDLIEKTKTHELETYMTTSNRIKKILE